MSIAETLNQDMKAALRAGARLELGALRLALAAIKTKEIESRAPLTDDAILGLLEKMIKQGRDAEQQFKAAGRGELAAKEAAEIDVLARYLPEPLGDDEIEALIRAAIETAGASSVKDMGRVMAAVKSKAQGRADMAAISAKVREILTTE